MREKKKKKKRELHIRPIGIVWKFMNYDDAYKFLAPKEKRKSRAMNLTVLC